MIWTTTFDNCNVLLFMMAITVWITASVSPLFWITIYTDSFLCTRASVTPRTHHLIFLMYSNVSVYMYFMQPFMQDYVNVGSILFAVGTVYSFSSLCIINTSVLMLGGLWFFVVREHLRARCCEVMRWGFTVPGGWLP